MRTQPEPKKQEDSLLPLKFMGYCMSQTPPGDDTSLEDFVMFAKFYLCKSTNKLFKDPVWDSYTDEEILVEYFAHVFSKDQKIKKDFEIFIDAGSDLYGEDTFEWLDRMVRENQAEMKKKLEEAPQKVSFAPDRDLEE